MTIEELVNGLVVDDACDHAIPNNDRDVTAQDIITALHRPTTLAEVIERINQMTGTTWVEPFWLAGHRL